MRNQDEESVGEVINARLAKAEEALEDAQYLLEDSRSEAAVNRAYYTALHLARAALLMKGEDPNSHKGILSRLSYHFIRSGLISEDVGKTLARAEVMRNRADYDEFTDFDSDAARDLLDDVLRFNEAVRQHIANR